MSNQFIQSLLFIKINIIFSCLLFSCTTLANEKVTLQLKWTHQFQFAGYYAAKAQGFYQAVGLDVEILAAEPEMNTTEAIISGNANYAIGTSNVLLDRLAGKPIVVLAVILQHSPYVIVAKANKSINSVHDLIGKRFMFENNHAMEQLAYLKREGINLNSINMVPHSFDVNSFINDEIEAYSAYSTNELFILNNSGIPYLTFTARAAGIDFYGDNLFTSEKELAENSERTEAFIQASLKGWKYAMSHQAEMVELIASEYQSKLSREHLFFEAKKMEELLLSDIIELGYMYQGRWQHIAEIYAELGLISKDYSLSGFMYQNNQNDKNQGLYKLYWSVFVELITILIIAFFAWRFYRLSKTLKNLLYFKNRLSNVGEAVRNISHQWKQPINKIAFQLMRMEQTIKSTKNIDRDEYLALIATSHETLQFMADTSDSFNQFFSEKKEKTAFCAAEVISSTLALLSNTFNDHQIIVTHNMDTKIALFGNQNEFSNVILSILNNAKEVFIKRETPSPEIFISMAQNGDKHLVITISDNAGGISQKPISSIFDSGVSSELDDKSNGLGLFIAKELINHKFNGKIYAKNNEYGAQFLITLPFVQR